MARPTYTYTIPNGDKYGVKTVSVVELTANEELQATKRARGDQARLAYELVKESLRAVDGRKVGHGDSTIEKVWDELHPKVRSFVLQAFTKLHAPADEEVNDFLASSSVEM